MSVETTNLGTLTPIHTDFGSNRNDLLVVEYDVPQTKVKQTLFYKYGQLSIPKWALIPASILTFGLLTALCAVIVNSILAQGTATVTYSQGCSATSKCKTGVGLICGSESKCACPSKQYWYEDKCVSQPTYTEKCNQTTECRTDLGLVCAELDGQCNCPNITQAQTCDCSSTSYWTGSICTDRSSYLDLCSVADTSYQCISNLYCNGTMCICAPNTQYWNSTADACYSVDKYLALCDSNTSYSCDASVSLFCLPPGQGDQCPFNATVGSTSCDCANGTYWNGGSCVTKKTINAACFWNCECNANASLQCLNMSCTCPTKYFWSTSTASCVTQKSYAQSPCYNTSECDSTQGLTCYLSGSQCNCPNNSSINMCDCLTTQYYDYNLTSCQTRQLYNETCDGSYMCDTTLGLFCQMSISNATNCSCPEPIRLYMCDCNITTFWDGVICTPRLAANVSCSFDYQCQAGLICIVNETDNGIFSDVCRCPLGYYYVSGSNCVPSLNYTESCVGSYQCYELAPLSCRYNYTGLTCLDNGYTPLPACDCQDNYFYNAAVGNCSALLSRNDSCSANCQCTSPYQCSSNNLCDCPVYYSSLNKTCVNSLWYGDQCSTLNGCEQSPSTLLTCINGTCACNSSGYWSGSQCLFTINFRSICQSNINCFNGLICETISCIDSNKRCSCPSNYYYSPSSKSCILCNGTDRSFERYVVNYPNSDLCVGIYDPKKYSSISFATANSDCAALNTTISPGASPQLISVHNTSELNCIATLLNSKASTSTCSNQWYYLGLNSSSQLFYDGTYYYPTFLTPTLVPSLCLTYCLSGGGTTGTLKFNVCSGPSPGNTYGAICDYRII